MRPKRTQAGEGAVTAEGLMLAVSLTGAGRHRGRLWAGGRAPALLISRLVSWVDDLWCRAIGAGV
ncbi:hypothetical protein CKW46_23655 [Mycobacterium liflandii]|nr:Butyryl-CoA dehydrogenase [Mycobacterium pseudoshottsii]ULL11862.1 hypothetical protein CKW46_23655 [Mycobacterium liflandii]